jgi:hypothetical protein
VVEGISELSEGVLLGERYRLVRRLDLFSVGAERVAGVEYEYWIAVDVGSETEVWIQFAAVDGVYAEGAALAGAVAALRRINHPAVPAVPAFGEYEFEHGGDAASVGYCAIPALEGETLAAALLRAELDQAEILAALGQVAEVLELLAEFELVHGHLCAQSVLLSEIKGAGYGVVLADLPASLALETTLESELTPAADVYALAWLIVLALVGPEVLEAEFGSDFAVTTELELELLAEEVAGRRLAWAAEYLVVLGVSTELAEVLLPALGEAVSRPRVSVLTAALRAEWMLYAAGVEELTDVAEVEEVAEVAEVEDIAAVEAAEDVVAAGAVEAAAAFEAVEAVEVAESAETPVPAAAPRKPRTGKKKKAAEVVGAAAVVGAVEVLAAESASAATGAAAGTAGEVAAANAGTGAAAGTTAATTAAASAGAASGAASVSGAAATGAAAAVTEIIPKIRQSPRPAQVRGAAGARSGGGQVRTASPSGPIGGGAAGSGSSAAGSGGSAAGSGGGAGGTGSGHGRPRRPRPGVLIGAGVGVVIVIALIIVFATGPAKSANAASSGSVSTSGASASASAAAGSAAASSGASASAGSGGGASASAAASSTAGSTESTATSSAGSAFPTTLATVPATASQAVQEIKTAVGRASGELSGTQRGQLGQIVSALSQEINSGQSISPGLAQFWGLLHSGELPSSLNTYLVQLATYLSASQGS